MVPDEFYVVAILNWLFFFDTELGKALPAPTAIGNALTHRD